MDPGWERGVLRLEAQALATTGPLPLPLGGLLHYSVPILIPFLQGKVTSFSLDTWLAVSLVTTAVAGSMMTWLLLVLCVENAFAHRLDITPYRSGCALIWESIVEWIQVVL